MTDSRLEQAFQKWEELSQTPESILAYDARLKAILDGESNTLKRKGLKTEEIKDLNKGNRKDSNKGKTKGCAKQLKVF